MTEPDDTPPALAVGAIPGDSDVESMRWLRAVRALERRVIASRGGVGSPLPELFALSEQVDEP